MGILSYLGFNGGAQDQPNPIKQLPSNWYSNPDTYDLERRAIFCRQWQLITHNSRLRNPGDFAKFEVAGFEFVLSHDRLGNINAFHNVCRHRAYPVVAKDCGSAKIFSCKYHGWSYGLNGKLAKAPGYQELTEFDKDQNGLFPVRHLVDRHGFIWVNLDSRHPPESDVGEVLQQHLSSGSFHETDFVFDHAWQTEAECNWKLLVEAHLQKMPAFTQPESESLHIIDAESGQFKTARADNSPLSENMTKFSVLSSFPNSSTSISSEFFVIQRYVPTGATSSMLTYQLFRHKTTTGEDCRKIAAAFQKLIIDTTHECTARTRKGSSEVSLHHLGSNDEEQTSPSPSPSSASHFQAAVRNAVVEHHEAERNLREEIWPARQIIPQTALGIQSHEDSAFCASLCAVKSKSDLAW